MFTGKDEVEPWLLPNFGSCVHDINKNSNILELSIKNSKENTKTLCLLKIANKVVEVG
jgi:hypothetical protein